MNNEKDQEANLPRINLRISDVQLREIDAAWTKKGKFNRSDGIRWLLDLGIQKVKEEGLI